MARDWVQRFFDAAYVGQLRAQWSSADTRKQVAFVVKALGLRRGARVLDVPCGFDRHARLLARRGMLVVGMDLSPAMIAEGRRGGRQPGLSFVRADMRQLAYQSEFDAVLNLYTSFGYFSPRANLDVLRRMARALKPGGRILLAHPDREREARLSGRWWDRAADGPLALQEMRFDRSTGRWSGEWTFVSPNGRRSVRPLGVFDDPSSRALGPVPRHGGLYCIRAGDGVVEELGHRGGHVERRGLGRWTALLSGPVARGISRP